MTQDSASITPPPELVRQWLGTYFGSTIAGEVSDVELVLATQAARWGADHELEACCEWLRSSLPGYDKHYADYLHAARRPKPPSLKEQALTQLDSLHADLKTHGLGTNTDTIRRALEQLND